MWASMMSVLAWLMSRDGTTESFTVRVMHLWTFLLLLVSADCALLSGYPGSAGEISPLLQTDLMVIHPPVVFVYYSPLCLATASIAVSGLIRSRPPMRPMLR